MDEDNKNDQQNDNINTGRPHVRVFGMDMDNGSGEVRYSGRVQDSDKEARRQRKEEWRMHRHDWHQHSNGDGYFAGILLLLIGIVALAYTLGFISADFLTVIAPFWPILLILWGASIVLSKHWFSRLILFIFVLIFFVIICLYGLVRTNSPLVSSFSPNIKSSINNIHPLSQ